MISENSIQQLVDRLARLEYIITQSLDTKNKRRNDDVIDEELNIDRYNANIDNDDHNDNDNKVAYKDGSNDNESKGTDNSDRIKDNYDEVTDDKMEYNNQLQQQQPHQQYHHHDDIADDDINYNKGGIQYYGYDDDYHEDTDVEEDKDDDFDDVFAHHTRNITTTKVTFNHDTTIINTLDIDHDEVNDGGDLDGNDEDVGGDSAELDDDDDNDFINPLMSMYEQTNHTDIKNTDNLDDMMEDDQYYNHNELFHPNYTNNSFIHNHIKIPSSLSNNNDNNNRRNSDNLMKIIPQSSSSLDKLMIVDTSINDYDAYIQDCISEYNGDDSNIVIGDDDDDNNDNFDVYDDGYDDNNEIDNTENDGHHFNEVHDDVSDYTLRDVIDGYDHYYEDGHDHDDDDGHADSNVNVRYV